MKNYLKPFKNPIYITKPILPDLELLNKKFKQIWDNGRLTNNGPKLMELEDKLKVYLKVKNASIITNGTIALLIAFRCLELSGEVITTPFTFPATIHALTWSSLTPVFCDIEIDSMNINSDKIISLITPHTSAILAVHIFGTPCNVGSIQKIADQAGIKVIYDAAHAFGIDINNTGIGNFGDISMFSLHATKIFHTAEGGLLTFSNSNYKKKIDLLRNFGIKNEEEILFPGINGKMNELQAALGLLVLEDLQSEIEKREILHKTYVSCLKGLDGILTHNNISNSKSNYQYFIIRINKEYFGYSRDEVYIKLKEYNIYTRKYFYPLCSDYDCYKHLPTADPAHLVVSHKVAEEVLTMPLYGELTTYDIEKICEILHNMKR